MNIRFKNLTDYQKKRNYCETCNIVRWRDVEHCEYCDVCVLELDHHCPWTSKCIAKGNLMQFYLWLACTFSYICYMGVICFLCADDMSRAYDR